MFGSEYESTQIFSPTFKTFATRLAKHLIERYDLHKKKIIEIGCGNGEFLTLLCELGDNRGIGFDPTYVSERNKSKTKGEIKFIKDFYSEKYTDYTANFICCRMTLEHIPNAFEFVNTLRKSLSNNTIVFFQVPDVTRILHEFAFWDIYYEHCSYFHSAPSSSLFRRCVFEVLDAWKGYDNQYLMLEAKASNRKSYLRDEKKDIEDLTRLVEYFSRILMIVLVINPCPKSETNTRS